jgi:opacity protein-like surface antigen
MNRPRDQQIIYAAKGRSQRGENEMKYQKTTLMAGIAALSLFAVSGLASAQASSKSESSKGATPHATQQMKQDEMSGHSGQNAQTQERGSLSKQGQRAEESNRGTKGEKSMSGEENRSVKSNEKKGTPGRNESQAGEAAQDHMNHGNTAQDPERDRNKSATENQRMDRSNTAQDHDRMGGKNASDGNRGGNEQQNRTEGSHAAAGMNVQLNEQQRTEIRTTVISAHGAPRVSHVDFDVTVGTVVPRERIHVVPLCTRPPMANRFYCKRNVPTCKSGKELLEATCYRPSPK